jgi:multimeric flavodoxin WrbA
MNALIINCSPVRTGATAEIARIISASLNTQYDVKIICIDDYKFDFCKGCRSCHNTAKCIMQEDDVAKIMAEFEWADKIISVSPSYWADIPGQFKAFIDRCTPWCNTHDPHATISQGKKGYSIALRTGPSIRECNKIIESIEHFYGHLEITPSGSLGLCSVEYITDVPNRANEIEAFCNIIKME